MDDPQDLWTSDEMETAFGIGRRQLRDFEARGFLKPVRDGQHRSYPLADRERLFFVSQARRDGFSLHEIEALLDAADVSGAARLPNEPEAIRAQLALLDLAPSTERASVRRPSP